MSRPVFSEDLVFQNSGTTGALIELYTSEGCSSCPPAEAWLGEMKNAPGLWKEIFPVAFHVDYWDGLGWPDRFAREEFTERQRAYATRLGQDSVYTPEVIANGTEWRGWRGATVPMERKSGQLIVTVKGRELSARYVPLAGRSGPLTLHVAELGMGVIVDVKRGENGGRKLLHDFVVVGFTSSALGAGADNDFVSNPVELKSVAVDSLGAMVAWVTSTDGTILQVAGGWLSKS